MTASLLAVALALAAAPEKPRLIVLDLAAQAGVDVKEAQGLTDAVTAEVARRGFFQVMSSREVQTLLGAEKQRQLLGCSEDGSCFTELAGAVGARFVMSGSIGRLGDAYQLSLQTLDTQKASIFGRSVRVAKDLGGIRVNIPYAVAEATSTPLPPSPSRVLPYTLLGSGGLVLIAGGVVGLHAVSQEALIQTELTQGAQSPRQLKTYAYYTQARSQYGLEQTVSLFGLLAGAGLLAAGYYLHPDLHGGSQLALLPTADGVAVRW